MKLVKNKINPLQVSSGINYLNVCAHCGECLKQLVYAPNKLNIVIFYKNDKGEYIEWKPEIYLKKK